MTAETTAVSAVNSVTAGQMPQWAMAEIEMTDSLLIWVLKWRKLGCATLSGDGGELLNTNVLADAPHRVASTPDAGALFASHLLPGSTCEL